MWWTERSPGNTSGLAEAEALNREGLKNENFPEDVSKYIQTITKTRKLRNSCMCFGLMPRQYSIKQGSIQPKIIIPSIPVADRCPTVLYTISPSPLRKKAHPGSTAHQPSCIMRCRTTAGEYLLNLRPRLGPCGKHRRSCTIITSKQTAQRSILTKWHLSKCYGCITVQPWAAGSPG